VTTEIYGWFTEGFDTADLHDAKKLLDQSSPSVRVNSASARSLPIATSGWPGSTDALESAPNRTSTSLPRTTMYRERGMTYWREKAEAGQVPWALDNRGGDALDVEPSSAISGMAR